VLPFAGLMLIGEFTSLDEPTDVSDVAAIAIFPADRPEFTGSERRIEPRDPTRKLKLPIVTHLLI
jgi:hypothetical protein